MRAFAICVVYALANAIHSATTFWEVFDPEWLNVVPQPNEPPPNGVNGYSFACSLVGIMVCDFFLLFSPYFSYSSLCHPWAAGATRWLTDNVLGLRATTPGFATYEFAPYLGMRI